MLHDDSVQVPTRLVQQLPGGSSLFVMPALDRRIAITKVITFTPANAGTSRPTSHGDIVVFDIVTGQRWFILDGPMVTARRTAAVSLLAAQHLAPQHSGTLLIVGAGVQGRAHLEAFVQGLDVQKVMIASRSHASANALAKHASTLGVNARVVDDPNAALEHCSLLVTCTPANAAVLHANPRPDAFITAVGAFTPKMVELSPELCRHIAKHGTVVFNRSDQGFVLECRHQRRHLRPHHGCHDVDGGAARNHGAVRHFKRVENAGLAGDADDGSRGMCHVVDLVERQQAGAQRRLTGLRDLALNRPAIRLTPERARRQSQSG